MKVLKVKDRQVNGWNNSSTQLFSIYSPPLPPSPEELREEDFNKNISYLFLIPKLFYVQTKERICLLVTKSDGVLDYRVSLQKINAGQYEEYWSPGEQEAKQGENCFEFDVSHRLSFWVTIYQFEEHSEGARRYVSK